MFNNAGPPHHLRGTVCRDCGAPISRISRGRCKQCAYVGLKRPVPADFAQVLRNLGSQGAAKHYQTSLTTLTRWRREIGLMRHERAVKVIMTKTVRPRAFVERPLLLVRDITLPGQAADFLRRWGAVYRCDATGKANAKGTHWRRFYSVLTDDEIVRTATRLGWRPFDS